MSKYIPIESLYAALDFIEKSAVKGEEEHVKCITKAIRDIKFVPADVEEVVRCRDCVMWDGSFTLNGQKKCLNMSFCTDGDFYCWWGSKE